MTDLTLPLRLSGAVWGHLVGDATGVPYEFRDPSDIGEVRFGAEGTHGPHVGSWTASDACPTRRGGHGRGIRDEGRPSNAGDAHRRAVIDSTA